MRAARTANSWTRAWGLTILSLGIFNLPAQAQQDALTDRADQGSVSQNHHHQYHHYRLIDVGTFGGPQSFLSSGFDLSTASGVLNKRGALVGWADTPMPDPYKPNCFGDCYLAHAFRLQNGVRTDLGVLVDGFNSAADGGINDGGLIAGTAQNGEIDPLIPGSPELRSVLWEHGVIRDLGTLPGGYESYSSGINNRGDVIGVASNATPDANSMSFTGYQARGFLWDRQHGMQDLGTLSGGTDSIAAMINEPGHVVGWAYTSSAPNANCTPQFALATGSFIWDKKTGMTDLGGFGGTCTLATDVNDKDQVAGSSNLTGDQQFHAFAWDGATGLTDLGTLGGSLSSAWAINEHGEVVGGADKQGDLQSDAVLWRKSGGKWQTTDLGTINGSNCSFSFSINASAQVVGISGKDCTLPFLWEDGGPMVDLNTLISSNSGIQVRGTYTINDHGEIAASGVDSKSNMHAVLLIPCDENHRGDEGCDYDMVDEAAAADPSNPAPMTDKLAAATSTQHLTSSEILAARMLRLPHIPGGAIHAGVSFPSSATVTDSQSTTVQKLTITSGTPPQGTVGKAYDVHCHIPFCGGSIVVGFPLAASGGVPPYYWTWAPQPSSSLPPSLSISPHFGIHGCGSFANSSYGICGTPTIAGSYKVTVKVTDSASPPAPAIANYTIVINGTSSAALSSMIATPP